MIGGQSAARYTSNKTLRDWIRLAERQGWTVTYTGAGHLKWWAPDGVVLIGTSSTPSDKRALSKIRNALTRAGVQGLRRM